MLKYLGDIIAQFNDIKSGIEKNKQCWINENPVKEIQGDIELLASLNDDAEQMSKAYAQKLEEARKTRDSMKLKLKILEKKVIGVHANDPEKLKDYYL